VLAEKAAQCFDLGEAAKHYPTRFMLYVAPVTTDRAPAITHADGSSRRRRFTASSTPATPSHREVRGGDRRADGAQHLVQPQGRSHRERARRRAGHVRRSGMDLLVLENFVVRKSR